MKMKIKTYSEEQLGFFPFYICSLNANYKQEPIKRPRGFAAHQIFAVNDGGGILKVGGKTYSLEKNDMFFLSAKNAHEYYGTDDDFSVDYLSFFAYGFEKIKKYYEIEDFAVFKNKNVKMFKKNLLNIYDSMDYVHEISKLCSLCYVTVTDFFDEACKREYSPIEKVYNYITSNYSSPVFLDDILEFYPYSKSKLCRDFKDAYNMTLFDMILKNRLLNAENMIKLNPAIKLEEVSKACGFNDVSYFCKMYKRFYGETPKAKVKSK